MATFAGSCNCVGVQKETHGRDEDKIDANYLAL
jgi:hypothetical protein